MGRITTSLFLASLALTGSCASDPVAPEEETGLCPEAAGEDSEIGVGSGSRGEERRGTHVARTSPRTAPSWPNQRLTVTPVTLEFAPPGTAPDTMRFAFSLPVAPVDPFGREPCRDA